MYASQRTLFGRFPRAVGVTTPDWTEMELRQFMVHSESEFDGVIDDVADRRNLYASISKYQPVRKNGEFIGNAVVADKVSFDFDSPAKAEPEDYPHLEPEEKPSWEHPEIPERATDSWVIDRMNRESTVREAVLGEICENVQRLATACVEQEIPVLGVFSGFGVHVHMMHQTTMSRAGDKMLSTVNKWVTKLNLACSDERASGRPFRIMRIPNIQRIDHDSEEPQTGLYTVPLSASEMVDVTPEMLIDLSHQPRPNIGSGIDSGVSERPEMKVHEDYLGPRWEEGAGQEKMRPIPKQRCNDSLAEHLVKEICRMPCVYERALSRNPPNDVRVKLGIMFLNAGYSPEEITNIIERLGWVDFDRETTKYQLSKLRESGKGDWSCKTMQAKGLCTRADEKDECEMHGYKGGNRP